MTLAKDGDAIVVFIGGSLPTTIGPLVIALATLVCLIGFQRSLRSAASHDGGGITGRYQPPPFRQTGVFGGIGFSEVLGTPVNVTRRGHVHWMFRNRSVSLAPMPGPGRSPERRLDFRLGLQIGGRYLAWRVATGR